MRKYQQLVLLLLSCFSIAILLTYRSENNRLKYVLQAVNFFGRNDAAVLRQIDNATKEIGPDYKYPIGIWQMIGDSFHSYSAYWIRNELVAGGDSLVLVVGKRGAMINFKCGFYYDDATRSVQGKFKFVRVDATTEDALSEFTIYHFYCRLTRDFGTPEQVFFIDVTSMETRERSVRLRQIRNNDETTDFSICLNLLNFNRTTVFGKVSTNLEQFFISHRALGIENFLVYNSDLLPKNLERLLQRADVNLHLMPFNFPFSNKNSTNRIRSLLETDCLLRNSNRAKFTTFLDADEFLYSNVNLNNLKEVLNTKSQKFEVPYFSICMEEANRLLISNLNYDPEYPKKHSVYIYRLPLTNQQALTDRRELATTTLTVTNVMGHHYVGCNHVSADGLRLWRSMLREDFIKKLNSIKYRVDLLI